MIIILALVNLASLIIADIGIEIKFIPIIKNHIVKFFVKVNVIEYFQCYLLAKIATVLEL
jgi:hypothetical protein